MRAARPRLDFISDRPFSRGPGVGVHRVGVAVAQQELGLPVLETAFERLQRHEGAVVARQEPDADPVRVLEHAVPLAVDVHPDRRVRVPVAVDAAAGRRRRRRDGVEVGVLLQVAAAAVRAEERHVGREDQATEAQSGQKLTSDHDFPFRGIEVGPSAKIAPGHRLGS